MSKSYNNTIDLFAEGKPLQKTVMGIVTDSTPVEAPKDPERCNVFALYSLFATEEEKAALAARYRAGGMGYGEAKKMLLEKINVHFGPARERRKQLAANPEQVEDDPPARRAAARARGTADDGPGAPGGRHETGQRGVMPSSHLHRFVTSFLG